MTGGFRLKFSSSHLTACKTQTEARQKGEISQSLSHTGGYGNTGQFSTNSVQRLYQIFGRMLEASSTYCTNLLLFKINFCFQDTFPI